MTLERWPIGELLEKLGGQEPSVGGGTASLVAAAQGAALLAKSAGITARTDPSPGLEELRTQAEEAAGRLLRLAQSDGEAFAAVVDAYRLPQGAARQTAIEEALERATQTPLEAADVCRALTGQAERYLAASKRALHTDVATGALLLWTGMRGCLLNALVNSRGATASQVRARCHELRDSGQPALALLARVEAGLC